MREKKSKEEYRLYYKAWCEAHKEHLRIKRKEYRESHKEEMRLYRKKHRAQINARRREYFRLHPESYKLEQERHREKNAIRARDEYKKNPEKFRARGRVYARNNPLHAVYSNMMKRCGVWKGCALDKLRRYMMRGITVCDEWRSYRPFKEWAMANGYDPSLQIDRIDNDRGYSPDNCRWVSAQSNSRNRGSNKIVEYNGEKMIRVEFAERFHGDLTKKLVIRRLDKGWPLERAISTPKRKW